MNREVTPAAGMAAPVSQVPVVLDPAAGWMRRIRSFKSRLFIPHLCAFLVGLLAISAAYAGERKLVIQADHPLSAEEIGNIKQDFRARLHQKLKESAHAGNNQYSVVAAANCTEGYVVKANVTPSASDVIIVSEQGALCDSQGCQGWQVQAERASDALFDLDITLECTREDWLVIEEGP